jgi:hypothetical protein
MYIIPVCSKGFATLIRAMKKLDSKCRHHRLPNNRRLLGTRRAGPLRALVEQDRADETHAITPQELVERVVSEARYSMPRFVA